MTISNKIQIVTPRNPKDPQHFSAINPFAGPPINLALETRWGPIHTKITHGKGSHCSVRHEELCHMHEEFRMT